MFIKRTTGAERRRLLRHQLEKIPLVESVPLVRLGSQYGGWQLVDDPNLIDSVAILAGAGEDISFDVELASLYNMTCVLVDPTDRAEAHVDQVKAAVGRRRTRPYSLSGLQEIASYELRDISAEQLVFLKAALWIEDGEVTIFPPANPDAVSHSIFQKRNSAENPGGGLVVKARSAFSLVSSHTERVRLAKLDIEGAELDVIPQLLDAFPNMTQLLVEFDFLKRKELPEEDFVAGVLGTIKRSGFHLVGRARDNFSFMRGLE